jgi:hypothetical protein
MTLFNMTIGIIGGAIAVIPLFFVSRNWAKGLIAIFAITIAFLSNALSQEYLYPQYLLWRFEKEINSQPIFILIAENHPKEYKEYIQNIQKSFKKTDDIAVVTNYTAALLNRIFNEHLEKAPNDPIDLYLKSTVELYNYLYTKMPQAIVVMETGSRGQSVDFKELTQDLTFETLLNRLLDTKKLIIQDSIKSPVKDFNHDNAKQALEKIYDNLSQKFGAEIIRNVFIPSEAPVPPRVSSLVILEFYGEIIATGKDTAGDIMRYIGSKNYQAESKK